MVHMKHVRHMVQIWFEINWINEKEKTNKHKNSIHKDAMSFMIWSI